MRTVLPGATIGILGEGGATRLFSLTAARMGYQVRAYTPGDDLSTFVAGVDVATFATTGMSAAALPSPASIAALECIPVTATVDEEQPLAEFALTASRGADGGMAFYEPAAIDAVDGVIDIVRVPAPIASGIVREARQAVQRIASDGDYVGVLTVVFELMPAPELIIREIIPGPGFCGLFTIDACVTGEFEQHLRAICGLPLGSTEMLRPAATALVQGDADWSAACAMPEVKIYPGDHTGHLTATAPSATRAKQIVLAARAAALRQV